MKKAFAYRGAEAWDNFSTAMKSSLTLKPTERSEYTNTVNLFPVIELIIKPLIIYVIYLYSAHVYWKITFFFLFLINIFVNN